MKFKIDENLPAGIAALLCERGHEADTVNDEGLSGAPDSAVLRAATADERVLLTLDKGIADLSQYPANQHAGVVLFRPDFTGRREVVEFIRLRLDGPLQLPLHGKLTVVGTTKIRTR